MHFNAISFQFHFHTSPGIKFKFTPNFSAFHFHFSFPDVTFSLRFSLSLCFLGTIGDRNGSFELSLFGIFFVGVSLSLRSMSEWILLSMPLDLWLIFDSDTKESVSFALRHVVAFEFSRGSVCSEALFYTVIGFELLYPFCSSCGLWLSVFFILILNFFSCCLVSEKVEEKRGGKHGLQPLFFIVSELYYKVFALSPLEWKVRKSERIKFCFFDSREIL